MGSRKKAFLKWAKITLILVYLVIVAGALVRMTGSGMGCPDWPKCFGYYIPPTDVAELTWSPGHYFEKGQVIIKDEALWVAAHDFTTGNTFDPAPWRAYTRHDYAIFNPIHTWIEYVNRLTGALAGIATIVMAVVSIRLYKTDKKLTLLSWFAVFLMGFQGWLGATVVYSVLNPVKITVHMVVALLIAALLLYIIWAANPKSGHHKRDSLFSGLVILSLGLSLVQVILGTQVRQFVDEYVKAKGYDDLNLALNNPDMTFYVHRSFSILVVALNLFLLIRNRKLRLGFDLTTWIFWLIILEIVTGFAMYAFGFPFGMQTLHLVFAAILFGMQFYIVLQSQKPEKHL